MILRIAIGMSLLIVLSACSPAEDDTTPDSAPVVDTTSQPVELQAATPTTTLTNPTAASTTKTTFAQGKKAGTETISIHETIRIVILDSDGTIVGGTP